MAATAPAAAPAFSSPFPGRTRWPLPPLHLVASLGPSSPAITRSLYCRCSLSAGQPHHLTARKARRRGGRPAVFAVKASAAEGASESSERWLLEPAGDGDCKHIGFRVPMPSAFELASVSYFYCSSIITDSEESLFPNYCIVFRNVVTVGRLPDKADMVIPVATVSSVHARLEKKDGALLVTDLGSTNGTFVDDKKLRPGAVAKVSPGSCITFGDTHLAIFRVSKLQVEDPSGIPVASEIKTETEVSQTEMAS